MAVTTTPVFPQLPKTAGITFAGSSHSTEMDPATVAPTTLLTAGADGALVTHVVAHGEASVTAEKIVLWVQPGGAGNWYVHSTSVLAAYTQAATTQQGGIVIVDKGNPDFAVRLAGSDKVGVTHHVDQQSMVFAEYTEL